MDRRRFLILITLAGIIFPGLAAVNPSLTNRTGKPNILFILIDDMGWKDIGFTGGTYYDTPHIDRMAAEGMLFLNAYSAAPVCTPSRGAIFSRKYPARTKLTTVFNGKAGPDDRLHEISKYRGEYDQYFEARHRHALPGTEVILVQTLAEGGYTTGFFGKWHCGECPGYYPDDRGFQVAKGYRLEPDLKVGHLGSEWTYGNFANLPNPEPDDYIADLLTDECISFIKDNLDRPFFAFLSHYIVHGPVLPRPDKLPKYLEHETTDQNNPGYAAMVESVDESMGRLIQTLRELGLEQNTLVIFTSDNGGLTPVNTSNYPLMGGKSYPFEAGIKVPLLVKWPECIQPGISSERIIGMDFYPTILASAGLPMRQAQHVDGLSLMPLFTNTGPLKKRPVIFHFPHYTHATGLFSSIIEDNWKLIRFYNDEEGVYLLYNLAADPQEQNDLADANTEIRDQLAGRLDKLLKDMDTEMPVLNPQYDHDANTAHKNLKSTLDLARRERQIFENRLKD